MLKGDKKHKVLRSSSLQSMAVLYGRYAGKSAKFGFYIILQIQTAPSTPAA